MKAALKDTEILSGLKEPIHSSGLGLFSGLPERPTFAGSLRPLSAILGSELRVMLLLRL